MKLKTNRTNRRRQWATAMAVLLTATFAAGPALADHKRNRRHDRHNDGYSQRYDRHDNHRRHHRGHRRHHRRDSYRHSRGYPVYSYSGYSSGHHERAYYCGPCSQRFSNYNGLSHHVHRVHHIPLWRLPFVIVDSVFHNVVGFIFFG